MRYILPEPRLAEGKLCYYACVWNMMRNDGCSITEAETFFLCRGLEITYELQQKFIGHSYQMIHTRNIPEVYLEEAYTKYFEEGADKAALLHEALERGRILLLRVDTGFLEYHPVYQSSDRSFPHFILMYGIDTGEKLAYIADPFIRNNYGAALTFKGSVPLEQITQAATAFGWLRLRQGVPFEDTVLLKRIRADLVRYLEGGISREGDPMGYLALERYFGDLQELETEGDSEFGRRCEEVQYSILLRACEPLLMYMRDILNEKRNVLNKDPSPLVEQLLQLSGSWRILSSSVLKMGRSMNRSKLPDVMGRGQDILNRQVEVFKDVLRLLETG